MSDETRLEAEKLAALAEFAAGAGHEINNPLAVISGRAQLLLAGEADPERRRDLAIIRQQALRIHEMIADLMHFARPAELRRQRIDPNQLVSDVVAGLAAKIALVQARVDCTVAAGNPVLDGDPTQLAVALSAVIENALEATAAAAPKLGTIEVWVAEQPGEIVIRVSDSGPGFGAEVRRHLFDPFYSGRSAGRGLGMGLAKCWRIVTLHGGRIEVDCLPRKGTTFTIALPTDTDHKTAGKRTRSAAPKAKRARKKRA